MKTLLLVFGLCSIAAAQCGKLVVNPVTGQLNCSSPATGAANPACSFLASATSCSINTTSLAATAASQILTQCFSGASTTQTPVTISSYAYTTASGVIATVVPSFSAAPAAGYCVANATGSAGAAGATGATGPTGPAGPAPSGTGAVVVNSGTAATVTPGVAGHVMRSNGTQYADSAIQAADVPTLNQNTTGTAANLSGTPTVPNGTAATTQSPGDNTTKLATTAYVDAGLSGKQGNLTLTTTGTSGASTLVGSTLNIPVYSGGGGSLTVQYNGVTQGIATTLNIASCLLSVFGTGTSTISPDTSCLMTIANAQSGVNSLVVSASGSGTTYTAVTRSSSVVVTAATAANPMVLTLQYAPGPMVTVGSSIVIAGATGTGCSAMNGPQTVSAVAGTSVTISLNGTGCTYTGSSGSAYIPGTVLTGYTPGMREFWLPDTNGTGGATTLAIDGNTATPLKESDCSTNPTSSDIVSNKMSMVWYNPPNFCLISLGANTATGTNVGFQPTPQAVTTGVTTSVTIPLNTTLSSISAAVPSCVNASGVGQLADTWTNTTTQMTIAFSPSAAFTGTCTAVLLSSDFAYIGAFSGLPTPSSGHPLAEVTDATSAGNCSAGSGTSISICGWNGSSWIATSGSAGSVAFSGVTAGTNAAALLVGTGGSLGTSGSGTISATTATNLASYPTLCTGSQFSQGLSSGSNNCATPSGGYSGYNAYTGTSALAFGSFASVQVTASGGNPTITVSTNPPSAGLTVRINLCNDTSVRTWTLPTNFKLVGVPYFASECVSTTANWDGTNFNGLGSTATPSLIELSAIPASAPTQASCPAGGCIFPTSTNLHFYLPSGDTYGMFDASSKDCNPDTGICTKTNGVAFSAAATSANVVFNNQANTYSGGGLQDMSAMNLKIPAAAAFVATANNNLGYDTTNKNPHLWANAADSIALTIASAPTNGHCPQFSVVSGVVQVVDSGSTNCGGGGSTAWSAIGNPTGNLALTMGADTSTFTYNAATGSGTDMFKLTDTTSNTGTGNLLRATTAPSSAAAPFQADSNGNGVQVSSTGVLAKVGTGHVNADQVNGAAVPASATMLVSNSSRQVLNADFPDVKIVPAANCNNATAGPGWSLPASAAPTANCIAGTNNLLGVLDFADTNNAQFDFELPLDWDTGSQPYVNLFFGSGTNTTGTVIFQVQVACTKADGSITNDPAFNTADVLPTKTMAAATRGWSTSMQLTQVTSGNNCVPGGSMIVKITRNTDTASAVARVSKAVITVPRALAVQAN